MTSHRIPVTLTLQGPLLSRGLEAVAAGIDAPSLRDDHKQPAIPGSLVRGLLRDAWTQFGWLDEIERWLGGDAMKARPADKSKCAYRRERSPLRFDDHWPAVELAVEPVAADDDQAGSGDVAEAGAAGRELTLTPSIPTATATADNTPRACRHRIQIDPNTGAVSGGELMLIETPFAAGSRVKVSGNILVRGTDAAGAAALARRIEVGLRWVPALGGLKGIGFGRLLDLTLDPPRAITGARPQGPLDQAMRRLRSSGDLAIGLRLVAEHPLCFPLPGPKGTLGNRYVTSESIPGAALKAVLARAWHAAKLPTEQLDALRITHAQPVPFHQEERPRAIPLSLAFPDTGDRISAALDLALTGDDELLLDGFAPRFQPDWKAKHWRAARRAHGWPEAPLERRLSVRNAIDPETRTVRFDRRVNGGADAGYLFSLETLSPKNQQGDSYQWLANLHLYGVPEGLRDAIAERLEALLSAPLAPLGKTKAAMQVTEISERPWPLAAGAVSDPVPASAPDSAPNNAVILQIQTLARLLPADFQWQASNDEASLKAAYAKAWRDLSDASLSLRDYYARQTLAGGTYWWKHFRDGAGPYRPLLLTEPGSVFVLDIEPGQEAEARTFLTRCRLLGLPQLPGIDRHWQRNPWLAENGYGEVLVCGASVDEPLAESAPAVAPEGPSRQHAADNNSAPAGQPEPATAAAPKHKEPTDYLRVRIRGQLSCLSDLHVGDGDSDLWKARPKVEGREAPELDTDPGYHRVCLTPHGVPYIPGSSLRGALRALLPADNDLTRRLFGYVDRSPKDGAAPGVQGGRLRFFDAFRTGPPAPAPNQEPNQEPPPYWHPDRATAARHSVKIDPITGTAEHRKLYSHELVPAGSVFTLELEADDLTRDELCQLLGLLARWCENDQTGLGAKRGKGWGRVAWHGKSVRALTPAGLQAWLGAAQSWIDAADADASAPPPSPDPHFTDLTADIKPATPPAAQAPALLGYRLLMDGPHLVNEPGYRRTRLTKDEKQRGLEHPPALEYSRRPDGTAILPGKGLVGVLRGRARRIIASIAHLHLGAEPSAASSAAETLSAWVFGAAGRRGALWISDAEPLPKDSSKPHEQMFNAIDRFTGGVKAGALFQANARSDGSYQGRLQLEHRRLDEDAGTDHPQWWKGLLLLLARDALEGELAVGWGKARGYGALRVRLAADAGANTGIGDWSQLFAAARRLDCGDPRQWITDLHDRIETALKSATSEAQAASPEQASPQQTGPHQAHPHQAYPHQAYPHQAHPGPDDD